MALESITETLIKINNVVSKSKKEFECGVL